MSHRFFRYYTFVGRYLLLYGRTNNVVKRRAALGFAACQSKKVLPAWFASVDADIRIVRRRHPHRSAQTSASVDADIRIGRRSHLHRSTQTSASVGADVLIGGYGIPAIPTQPPQRHPHAISTQPPHAADCVGIAGMLYPPTDCVEGVSKLPI